MPEITFVLPHWLYWSGLVVFPLLAMFFFRRARRQRREQTEEQAQTTALSLPLGYFLLIIGGFVGTHRMYLRSAWALAFIALFVSILLVNVQIRESRDILSGAGSAVNLLQGRIERAQKQAARAAERRQQQQTERAQARYAEALAKVEELTAKRYAAEAELAAAQSAFERWNTIAEGLAAALLLLLLADAALLPRLLRRCHAREAAEREALPASDRYCMPQDDGAAAAASHERFALSRWIGRVNLACGEYVAYWSIVAVFVYYYEVIARYVFNSPTNWAHEGMFLMFGMQYLIAGGFCLRHNAHVRVDVIYMHLSTRAKAITDVITSMFFFIFTLTLLVTGWIFFSDSFNIREVSFTEWGIQYYPIKFAIPLGAALIILQGAVRLTEDIATVARLRRADASPATEEPTEASHGH